MDQLNSSSTPGSEPESLKVLWVEVIVSMYGVLFLVGFIGNVSVLVTICRKSSGQRQPHRHSLNLSLTLADLLITLLCYPMNAMSLLLPSVAWPFPFCHMMVAVQSALHASSTFSMAILAVDRFLTVRKPKMVPMLVSRTPYILSALWFVAFAISVPNGVMINFKRSDSNCRTKFYYNEEGPWRELPLFYFSSITLIIYILPSLIVLYCHCEVASSLRQRAFDDTKLQQKPKQMIIVAKDRSVGGNPAHKIVPASSSVDPLEDEDKFIRIEKPDTKQNEKRTSRFFILVPSPTPVGPSRNIQSIIRAHRRLRLRRKVRSSSLLTDHRSQSVETRYRLAKLLIVIVVIFSVCWIPYACILIIWSIFDGEVMDVMLNFSLLLGHAHSAFSPFIYWLMNRSLLSSIQRIVSSYLHCSSDAEALCCGVCSRSLCFKSNQSAWVSTSSTNEAALGPFHPRYVNTLALRPLPSRCTSHYFH